MGHTFKLSTRSTNVRAREALDLHWPQVPKTQTKPEKKSERASHEGKKHTRKESLIAKNYFKFYRHCPEPS